MNTPMFVLIVIAYSHPFSSNTFVERDKISGRQIEIHDFTTKEKCLLVRDLIKQESKETYAECWGN